MPLAGRSRGDRARPGGRRGTAGGLSARSAKESFENSERLEIESLGIEIRFLRHRILEKRILEDTRILEIRIIKNFCSAARSLRGAASGRAVTACPGWAGGQARIGRINRRARSKIITQSLEERVPDLSQPCSSHSRMAPVSCSTEIAQPRSVRIAGHLSLNISIGISLRPRTNPCRPTAFRAANTDQGFGIRGAVACPRVPSP
jgi:hypothetical protein